MQTQILHLDLDSFFVSVERILDPSLLGKPVIVGGTSTRGVVSSCSYEARQYGIHSTMPTAKAKKLCPHAIFLKGRSSEYSRYSKMVTTIIADRAPLFEKASIDEFYIDLTGMDKYFGSQKWATELRQTIIAETGLPISWGLSCNKMMAKMATNQAKPNGMLIIPPGTEQAFLDPLPVEKIPGCGDKTTAFLNAKGIYTIYQLRQFSREALFAFMSESGISLWNRAHGRAGSNIQPHRPAQSISSERTFGTDTDDVVYLKKVMIALAENLGFELRNEKKLSRCIAVKIRYHNFETHTKQLSVPLTSNTKLLAQKALHLFTQCYDTTRKVRLLGLRFSELEDGAYQINLFDDRQKDVQLYKAIDQMKMKHGSSKITLAQNLTDEEAPGAASRWHLDKKARKE